MAKARQKDQWNHTASLLAMQFNTAAGRRGTAKAPIDFHPVADTTPKKRLTNSETTNTLHEAFGIKVKK